MFKTLSCKLGTAPVVSLLIIDRFTMFTADGECIRMDVLLGQSTTVVSRLLFLYRVYFCRFLYRVSVATGKQSGAVLVYFVLLINH